MSIHFHRVRVKEVKKETPDCVSVLFDIPEHLHTDFSFTQGQSLTIRTFLNGEEVRRTYSLCSSPLEKSWRVAIKKVDGGIFSSYANEQLKPGDELELMEPVGKFNTPLNPAQRKQYTAFAAGSGITPVISLVKTTLATEPGSRFTLVYGNRTRSSVIFFEELEGLKNKYMERFQLIYIFSREKTDVPVTNGRINPEKLEALTPLLDYAGTDEFFICGPEEMIFGVKDYLESKGTPKKNIHFELFNTTGAPVSPAPALKPETAGQESCEVTLKLDGRSIRFNLPFSSRTTILDAALQEGADLPYACKGGMCCTCKARLLEGEVSMDVHWGLEDEEVEKGFILTCQSHPLTEKVQVDFDVK